MSRIDELIAKYCPNGVEYKSLADLEDNGFIKLGRGNVISKTDLRDNPGDYPVYSSSATGNGALGYYSKYMFDDERLSWSIDGGGRFFYRPKHKYSITNVCGWLKVLNEEKLSTKYLFYVLTNEWVKKVFDYTKKAHPSVIRKEYTIPVPPLAVQEEIVNILNSFTLLEAELEAELVARKKQYEHYRDELLNPENMKGEKQWKKLEEVCEVYTGGEAPVDCVKGVEASGDCIYPVYGNGKEIYGYSSSYKINKDAVCISSIGANTGAVFYYKKCFTPIIRLKVLVPKNSDLNTRYLYYIATTINFVSKNGGGIPNMNANDIKKQIIPVPPLAEQERIVSILDKFDALVNDISDGLPAEINARRQQYEYYRDKLLNFEPMAA